MTDRDNFLWKIYGGTSTKGTNDQIMPRVDRWGEGSQKHFPVI